MGRGPSTALCVAAALAAFVPEGAQAELRVTPKGSCTVRDVKLIEAAGGGHGDGSFTKLNADCGAKAWNAFTGINPGSYKGCLKRAAPVSEPCAQCFAEGGVWGYSTCKWHCMVSWCSASCIGCNKAHLDKLDACIGATAPRPTICTDA
uniref:Uncharacterized protein n=1 Tax=Zooxanthella nutricula TaxID=1333877 RepID=A0A7S2VSI1_9DINO